MNLVELIIMVCTIANPNACEERHLLFDSSGSLRSCMLQAEPYMAHWAGEHPKLRIMSWRCAWPGSEGEKS